MFKSVVGKLWITIFALILGILLVFSLFLSHQLEKIYFSTQVKLMSEHAQQWEKVILSGMPPDRIQQELEFWGGVSHYNLAVFNSSGAVIYSSDLHHFPIGKKSNWVHTKAGIENKETYYTGYNPDISMQMTATFLPFKDKANRHYMIMVHAPAADLLAMIKATRNTGVYVLLLFFVLSSPLAWYFSTLIAKPLIKIRKVALNMAKGDFSTLVSIHRNDELGDLAQSMNILSTRLNNTLNSLAKANNELSVLLDKWKEFVADVSHELRTPLFLIQGYSEAMLDNLAKDESTRTEYLTVINSESLRLQKLVNDLLAVESGLPLQKTPTDIYALCSETLLPFTIIAKERNITLELADELKQCPRINIDTDKIREVLYNLIDNALRYTPDMGKISISGVMNNHSQLELTFTNTGPGIPAEHLPHLFDRFYRVDKSRSRANGGTGLGLSIVKKIIEQHDGTISVTSNIVEGTAFKTILPVE